MISRALVIIFLQISVAHLVEGYWYETGMIECSAYFAVATPVTGLRLITTKSIQIKTTKSFRH